MGHHRGAQRWDVNCKGCGLPIPTQVIKPGSLRRYHRECQVVVRRWSRLVMNTGQLRRYHALKLAGASQNVALFGATSESRMQAALDVLKED